MFRKEVNYGSFGFDEITKAIAPIATTYNTNRIGAVGAAAAIDDKEFTNKAYQNNTEQRELMQNEMKAMGVEIVPSNASFIYFAPGVDTRKCMDILESENVFIRYFSEKYIRVSIGTPHQNRIFLDVLKRAIEELKE